MIANYHTHTPRCNHAVGTEEEYVRCAIEAGLQILGFSDHTPYPFTNGYRSRIRMGVEEFPEYARQVNRMKEKYAGKIQIHLGVEAEYYPKLFPKLLDILREQDTEYLLLGQHYLYNEEDVRIFSYMAHPDLIHYLGDADIYRRHMRRLCCAAKDCNVPLEVNLLGLQENRHYPNDVFWEIAAEEECPVIFGMDAHTPEALCDKEVVQTAEEWIARYGLKKMEMLALRSIK